MRRLLALALLGVAVAAGMIEGACGPAPEPPRSATTTATATANTTTTATANTTTTTATPSGPVMNAPRATAFVTELADIGLDAKSVPKWSDLTPKQIRSVMQLFRQSLGARCGDCHVPENFTAPSRMKTIAEHMWNDITTLVALADGSPVFCDSCHQGKLTFLNRGDLSALKASMKENFVDKLARKDAQEHRCTTCHVSDTDFALLDKWAPHTSPQTN